MNIKKVLALLLFPNAISATEEIPKVTIHPNNDRISYKTASLLIPKNQTHIISADQISTSGSQSLSDILNAKNGIQTQSISPGEISINMRGFGGNASGNTLILLNGQPYTNPDLENSISNTIPVSEIEQIEISPSSNSILYGDQAVGGIVNITTKAPQVKNNKITITSGNFSTYQTQFNFGDVKENDFGYRLSASVYTTNNYREHNAERINNFDLDLNYQDAYFRYRKINQHLELPGKLTLQQAEQNPRQAENNTAYINQDHDIVQLGTQHYLSPNWVGDIDLTMRLMRGTSSFIRNSERQVATLRPKISGVVNFKKYSIIPIVGVDLNYGKYESNSSLGNTKNTQNQGALYGQLTIPLTQKISTILGSRYGLASYHLSKPIDNETNPMNKAFVTSTELSWQTLENLSLFIRRSEDYRFPKTDEIIYTPNNTLLKTQKGVSYETGMNYKNRGFIGSLTAYQLNLKNEILVVPTISNPYGFNVNLDPTRRNGAILDLSLDLTNHLQLNADYNFVNAKFTSGSFEGKNIPFVAKHNLRLATIFKPQNNLQFLIEGIYTGNRYQINDVENIASQLSGFTIYNCGISYEKSPYTLTLRGNNLTNKLYYGYVVAVKNTPSAYYPSAGINILATLSVKI